MHVHLVAPSSEDSTYVKPLWAAVLAAHTPDDFELTFRDASLHPLDLTDLTPLPDLVGISVNTKTAAEAYRIADAYRRLGIPVVLGGVHASMVPSEAAKHASALVIGEAEGLWEQLLLDASLGRLQPTYRHEHWIDLAGLPPPRRDIFRSRRYVPFDVVQTARGCPYPCEFCSVSVYNGDHFRFRPIREVMQELEQVSPRVLLGDDNVMVHTARGRELLREMAPLRKHWVGQCSLAALHRPANLELLARSGCKALFIGFESVDGATTKATGKQQNDPRRYHEVVRRLGDQGIAVWGSFVFGLDGDGPRSFDRTVDFCIESKMTVALFALLTPYPGTTLYERLERQGRLVSSSWWLDPKHEQQAPVYEPHGMSRDDLRQGWVRAWLRMYSLSSIAQRYDPGRDHTWVQNLAYWPLNLTMREIARHKIAGGRMDWRRERRVRMPLGF